VPADKRGRSAQEFLMEVEVRKGSEERCAIAAGRDIYAVTAPIVVEAAERILAAVIIGTLRNVVPVEAAKHPTATRFSLHGLTLTDHRNECERVYDTRLSSCHTLETQLYYCRLLV
jgi:hypothetical protein